MSKQLETISICVHDEDNVQQCGWFVHAPNAMTRIIAIGAKYDEQTTDFPTRYYFNLTDRFVVGLSTYRKYYESSYKAEDTWRHELRRRLERLFPDGEVSGRGQPPSPERDHEDMMDQYRAVLGCFQLPRAAYADLQSLNTALATKIEPFPALRGKSALIIQIAERFINSHTATEISAFGASQFLSVQDYIGQLNIQTIRG